LLDTFFIDKNTPRYTSLTMTESIALHEYLDPRLIHVKSEVSSRKKLLQEMARLLSIPLCEADEECKEKDVYHALLEREKLGNTGIGSGVALPHSRFAQANNAVIAIITTDSGIDYDSIDGQDVNIAFGLIVPQEATQEHLRILADIAGLMSQEDNRLKLLAIKNAEQVVDLIENLSAALD
jgi:PTS system nitrogen regulatory IIA component